MLGTVGYATASHSVTWSHDGRRLATTGYHLTAWNVATGYETLRVWPTARTDRRPGPVAWSPDDRRAVAAWDNVVHLFDLAEKRESHRLRGHTGAVFSLAWSPDGKRIASASQDETIRIWDAATGQEVVTFRNHPGSHRCVAWSPDGRRLASGSYASDLRLWEAETGRDLLGLAGHNAEILALAFSPDGRLLASAGRDQTVRLWLTDEWCAAAARPA